MRAVRAEPRASNGWNNGDIDELVLMFERAMVWDGDHPSKAGRDHLIEAGYAERRDGFTALTGKGKWAALFCWPMPLIWFRRWQRRSRRSLSQQGGV